MAKSYKKSQRSSTVDAEEELRQLRFSFSLIEESIASNGAKNPNRYVAQIERLIEQSFNMEKTILLSVSSAERDGISREFHCVRESFADTLDTLKVTEAPRAISESLSSRPNCVPFYGKLDFPTFNGDIKKWPNFSQLFQDQLNSYNSAGYNITQSQKLSYLSKSLTGSASQNIANLPVAGNCFDAAWAILEAKYNNKREVAYNLADTMLAFTAPATISELQQIVDSTHETLRGLTLIGDNCTTETIVATLLLRILPPSIRTAFKESLPDDALLPLYVLLEHLQKYINNRSPSDRIIPRAPSPQNSSTSRRGPSNQSRQPAKASCYECTAPHFFKDCPLFTKAQTEDRINMVKRLRLCLNCLAANHSLKDCSSNYSCQICHKRHHTKIHRAEQHQSSTSQEPQVSAVSALNQSAFNNLLPTAQLKIKDNRGKYHVVRALIDTGSQICMGTTSLISMLGLPTTHATTTISTAGGGSAESYRTAKCAFVNSDGNFGFTADLIVTKTISSPLPQMNINPTSLQHLTDNKVLADSAYYCAGSIDLLLGIEIFAKIVLPHIVSVDGVTLQNSRLGWLVFGNLHAFQTPKSAVVAHAKVACPELHRFWEIEEVPVSKPMLQQEQKVEEFVETTTSRTSDGKYMVRLPLLPNHPPIGATRPVAVARLKSLERKFFSNPAYKAMYCEVMNEYINLGHCEPVPSKEQSDPEKVCYLPHHGVYRKEATTTKLRVVFDASSRSSTGISLNDLQSNGPRLQEDLFALLCRFRYYKVALTADIQKMYRQIWLHPDDRDMQRILWRPEPQLPIAEYRLTTVSFGQKVAPYLAVKCLQMLGSSQPLSPAAKAIQNDFYVDDLLTGADDNISASILQQSIQQILLSAGLSTHKWACNEPSVLRKVPISELATGPLQISDESKNCTLGVEWDTTADTLRLRIHPMAPKQWTRRGVLSAINSVFDPMGWSAPVTVTAKILMQAIVSETSDWDAPISTSVLEQWVKWYAQISTLSHIKVPRTLLPPASSGSYCICGFSDASEKAYGCVVYLRTSVSDVSTIRLVAAKTRVKPLKPITIPRLELLAALLLGKLTAAVIASLPSAPKSIYAYTDSSVVLSWIQSDAAKFNTFVANRVAEIQTLIPPGCWQHVKGEDNPADVSSRGISASELRNSKLWWQGPDWLVSTTDSGSSPLLHDPPETRRPALIVSVLTLPDDISKLLRRFSSYAKLRRVMAIIWAFADVTRRRCGPQVTADHYKKADNTIYRLTQHEVFATEIAALQLKQFVPLKSPLAPLNPILDENGIIRVGGRLRHATLPEKIKHPVILPARHHITQIIVRDCHTTNLHAGQQHTLSLLRRTFWVLKGPSTVKSVIHKCVICTRDRATLAKQMMADLPMPRVQAVHRPFLHTGVDFCGPFSLKTQLTRSTRIYKAYVALFVCFSTRALHLEPVTALSTSAFLAAFARFTSRRSVPAHMYSDNGTNFVGADREMQAIIANGQENLAARGTKWHFNPPAAPHFGGLWEAGVKSTKTHLRRIVGNTSLTYEEFYTVLCRIEAVLNSRPMLPLSNSDSSDLCALTPAHFLVGETLATSPEEDVTDLRLNSLSRWQLVQRMTQNFWKIWSAEYVTRLQQRPRWWRRSPNIEPGRTVLIQEPNRPPLDWRLGRVVDTHAGDDEVVRVVTVRTASGNVQRPIHKLVLLPLDTDDQPTNP